MLHRFDGILDFELVQDMNPLLVDEFFLLVRSPKIHEISADLERVDLKPSHVNKPD
jgi:hypothetical protein